MQRRDSNQPFETTSARAAVVASPVLHIFTIPHSLAAVPHLSRSAKDMKLYDSQSSADYFKSVANLAERLAKKRVAVYEHSFTYMAFGSWEIVAGRRKKMLRFTYDGKDSYLSFCDTSVTPKSHTDLQHRRFATHEGEYPFTFVAEVLEKEFAS